MLVVVDPRIGPEAHALAAALAAAFGRQATVAVGPEDPPDAGLAAALETGPTTAVLGHAPPPWLASLHAIFVEADADPAVLIARVAERTDLGPRTGGGHAAKLEPLAAPALQEGLAKLGARWRIELAEAPRLPHGLKAELVAEIRCPDHLTAAELARAVADVAEAQDHHPTLVQAYRSLTVRVTTGEAAGRLTGRDLRFAEAVDGLVSERVPAAGSPR